MRLPAFLLALTVLTASALAEDAPSYTLEIHEREFAPARLVIPPATRVKLLVTNARSVPAEFESFDLNREKVVPPGATVTVWVGPLALGTYKVFDDFNSATTGWIVVAAPEPATGAQP
jgi:hypothetical protein